MCREVVSFQCLKSAMQNILSKHVNLSFLISKIIPLSPEKKEYLLICTVQIRFYMFKVNVTLNKTEKKHHAGCRVFCSSTEKLFDTCVITEKWLQTEAIQTCTHPQRNKRAHERLRFYGWSMQCVDQVIQVIQVVFCFLKLQELPVCPALCINLNFSTPPS